MKAELKFSESKEFLNQKAADTGFLIHMMVMQVMEQLAEKKAASVPIKVFIKKDYSANSGGGNDGKGTKKPFITIC